MGSGIPNCPKGQRFDTAAACACVPEAIILERENMAKRLAEPPAPIAYQPLLKELGFEGADACTQTSDCVIVGGPCGEAVAINHSKAKAFSAEAQHRGAAISCVRADLSHTRAVCEAGRCVVTDEVTGK